ncbi:MAG TPA: tRNA (adenosine(37)-N6)-threonylcarbamoyltransferase complex ATPase subunit type 1 TsaE [Acidobacteriaceae bacterium]|jgi:tRNA threonylcarbamoyladenosine biosynthesis protein TsaE|nr:tRNA (adenosine(37)-N6)-threonylcarbamoyltransferase complex ATPase subunit type 1 TsaE [Acidobacteriaceae bacterium]
MRVPKSNEPAAPLVYTTHSSEETIALGRKLAKFLTPPKMLVLRGDLGAGKTTLVKGIAAALGAADPEEVTSPTFTLIHEYQGSMSGSNDAEEQDVRLYHLDLYRIEGQRQLDTLGIEELMTPESILLIEWGEKFPWIVAHSSGEIVIDSARGDERRIALHLRS